MARRRTSTEPEVAPEPPEQPKERPKTVRLQLKQNDFIGPKFAPAGTVIEVSEAEARKRLTTEDKWERV